MKKEIILLLCFIVVLLFACSKEETPNLPEIESGIFNGEIGRVGYYNISNDKLNKRITTTYFDGKAYQSQFNGDVSPTIIDGNIYELNQTLTINLEDPLNVSSFLLFETYKGASNYRENWISVDQYEQWDDKETTSFYTTVKEKQSIKAEILSVNYRELRVPSLKVKIKGYLYDIDNRQDSILIDATFTTQASYEQRSLIYDT